MNKVADRLIEILAAVAQRLRSRRAEIEDSILSHILTAVPSRQLD
jgi:hypothetical protein